MQGNEQPHEERLVLLFERQGESVNDGSQNLQELSDPIVSFRLVNEIEEHVVDASPDGSSQVEELPVYPMQRCLEEIALAGVLGIEEFEQVQDERLVDVPFGQVRIEIRTFDKAQEEFVDDLEVRPGKLKNGFIFFWIVSVACGVDRWGYGAEEVGSKL